MQKAVLKFTLQKRAIASVSECRLAGFHYHIIKLANYHPPCATAKALAARGRQGFGRAGIV
jgi:hypothetical protein